MYHRKLAGNRRDEQVVWLHPQAPPKPAPGAACNGCGLCCAAEPCPLGVVLTRRWRGRCAALQWDEPGRRHRCGALAEPRRHLRLLRWLPLPVLQRVVRRWIAAGAGCDSSLELR
jgi:hypothetical protein